MFVQLDAYWNSDQSYLDEFGELSLEHLQRLIDADTLCLEAMDREPDYWAWREKEGLLSPSWRKPLSEVRKITERHLRLTSEAWLKKDKEGRK